MKIKEVKGFPKKLECDRHQNATDTPCGASYCMNCLSIESYNAGLMRVGDIEIEIDEEKMAKIIHGEVEPDGWTTKGSKDLAHTIAQQCPIKKKLDFIIPTADQRERQEYEQGMRDEHKRAESDGYKTIR